MLRLIGKIVLRLLLSVILLLLVILVTLNLPFDFFRHQTSETDYSDWMGETLSADAAVIDVAMLGAHDAFTSDISYLSQTDLFSADSIQTGVIGALIKGFSVKQSKTQVSGVTALLNAGVRYFDIRLTYNEKEAAWYTSHTYYSTEFAGILAEMETWLDAHPGEFLLLDIQHVNGIDVDDPAENDPAFLEIRQLFAEAGILDRAYPQGIQALSEISYGEITSDETAAGVLIFTKLTTDDDAFWSYGASVRSAWPNTDSAETAFAFFDTEAALIASGEAMTGNQMGSNPEATDSRAGIRVLQGVLTMQMSGEGIVDAIVQWSLLSRARDFNSALIARPEFGDWLTAMPIVMVDYADTNAADFLDLLMAILVETNQNA